MSLAREPARLTLRVWEFGLSSAASAARLGLDLINPERSGSPFMDEGYMPPPPPTSGNGGPPEEVVLVAEDGAEDGPGPELHVDPPWDGYDQMTAVEIRDRLAAGDAVVAAAVSLYEATNKSRRTVLDAAERALKS
jgi:hypothetical protein